MKLTRKAEKVTVAVVLDEELKQRVDAVAKENGVSRSDCVRQLLEKALMPSRKVA